MKLNTLSQVQKNRLGEIKAKYIKSSTQFTPINKQKSIGVIKFAYSLVKREMPIVYSVSSPMAAQRLANKLNKTDKTFYQFGSYLTIGWQSFYALYDTFVEFGIITKDKFPKYFQLREFIGSGIFLTIEFEKAIIVCEKPIVCKRNENGLHCTDGVSIKWRDGYGIYFINGRKIDRRVYEKALSGNLTKENYINETNDEVRSAWYEILGGERLMELLDASLVDETSVVHKNGEVEKISIFRTKEKLNKIKKEPYAWVKRICPSTGATYLTPTDPKFNKAIDAAKFHRPEFVPKDVDYSWYSRS